MATALQQQLAQIAAKSTHQLDLKAQKSRHSQSLLSEPRDAATQSFDTLFQTCVEEGFNELCELDVRFTSFAHNIFAASSKDVDRTQLTAKENAELDGVLQKFLGLVQGRLLLRPAVKSVEWLIRRFRVHEYNTEALVLAFLPYHTADVFATLLSLLSAPELPPAFKWLHPYIASLQSPPRSAILSAISNNTTFFSAFNDWVLRIARAQNQSAILLGFWASLVAQAINGMLDSTASGRENVRKQREEDLIVRILPVLQSTLSINNIPELYLGTCMIITILVSKAQLQDKVLDAIMEAVMAAWTDETMNEGLICLAAISEEKHNIVMNAPIAKHILCTDGIVSRLRLVGQHQRVVNLAAGLALGALKSCYKTKDARPILTVQNVLNADILDEKQTTLVLEEVVALTKRCHNAIDYGDLEQASIKCLQQIASDPRVARTLQIVTRGAGDSMPELALQQSAHGRLDIAAINAMDVDQPDDAKEPHEQRKQRLRSALNDLPHFRKSIECFFDVAVSAESFERWVTAFTIALALNEPQSLLDKFPDIGDSKTLLRSSFLLRLGTSKTASTSAKMAAFDLCRQEVESRTQSTAASEIFVLVPYALISLADPAAMVRKASAGLLTVMSRCQSSDVDLSVTLARIYGVTGSAEHTTHRPADVQKLLSQSIAPILEDCVIDSQFLGRALVDILNNGTVGSEHSNHARSRELKKTTRADLCSFFASHAVMTPLSDVRLWSLRILNRVGKSAMSSRKDILLPFVRSWIERPMEDAADLKDSDNAILGTVTHRTIDEARLLQDIISGDIKARSGAKEAAFKRIQQLFPLLKSSQQEIVDVLLNLANSGTEDDVKEFTAVDLLRALPMPTEILGKMLASLPSVSDIHDQPPSSKKRRHSRSETTRSQAVNQTKLQPAIHHITLVLEIVESSKSGRKPELLRSLFHFLSELHHYKTATGSDLVYLYQMLLGSILSIVDMLADSRSTDSTTDIDTSSIRTDLVVECLRTTKSTQIHNTALFIVSRLAAWRPELVLHSVMPLFTFMSTTVLRQSDDYSAHAADETVTKIIPPMAGSLKKRGKDIASGAAELLLSFVAAYEHIPLQRRLPLFELLVSTLGENDVLFAVIAMLTLRYDNEIRTTDFIRDLALQFDACTVLTAASKYISLVEDGLRPKRGLSDTLLSLNEKNRDEIRLSIEALLDGLSMLLSKDILRSRISANFAEDGVQHTSQLRTVYVEILEKAVQLTQSLTSNEDLSEAADSVLRAVLGLLPTDEFINSSAQFMQVGSDATRQQVFRSLELRAQDAKRGSSEAQRIFLSVLPGCIVYIQEDQPVKTRHAAIACIDQISEKFGKADTALVLAAAESVVGPHALGSGERDLRIISLLTLSSLVDILGEQSVGLLPRVLQHTILYLAECIAMASNADSQIIDAGFSLLAAVSSGLPWMLSTGNLDSVVKLVDNVAAIGSNHNWTVTHQQLCSSLAKKIPPAGLFPSLDRTMEEVLLMGPEAVQQHLNILHQAIKQHTKAAITKNSQILFTILLKTFDLRRQLSDDYDDDAEAAREKVLAIVNTIAMDLTLKLNDTNFRPFFMNLIEWASSGLPKSEEQARVARLSSVFSFTSLLFEQLQSLVTSYSSFLLDTCAEILQGGVAATEGHLELLGVVLKTLSSSFRYDQNDFWQAPAHFEAMSGPLISHLKSTSRTTSYSEVIQTLAEFAGAASSPEHLKSLNTSLLALMKDGTADVRMAALKCERSITEKLSLEWLTLLPEMLPTISELMEDDSEDVEREVLKWISEIEEATGESLEGMLA